MAFVARVIALTTIRWFLLLLPFAAMGAATLWWLAPPAAEPIPGGSPPAAVAPPSPAAQAAEPILTLATPRADVDYDRCLALAMLAPREALVEARRWSAEGGGDAARHCEAVALIEAGETEAAAEILEALGAHATAPADARAALLAQATRLWLALDRPDRAQVAATRGLAARPDDPDLLTDRAIAAAALGRFSEAIEDLSRLIAREPDRSEALILRASAWRQAGDAARAAADLTRVLLREPENAQALLERALLSRDRGDLAAARRDLERVLALASDQTVAGFARDHLAALEAEAGRR